VQARSEKKEKLQGVQAIDSTALAYTLDTAIVQSPPYLQISGTAPSNALIGLWQNGKFVSSVISNYGLYQFPPQFLALGKNLFVVWALCENGKKALIDTFSIDYFSLRLAYLSGSVSRLKTQEKILSLTFDAGAGPNGADSIIKILREQNLRSTFFLTGKFIRDFPELIGQLIRDGHELANHTYSHPHLTSWAKNGQHSSLGYVSREFIYSQLNKTDSIFYSYFKQHLKPLWRAPYGEYNKDILRWAAELGYKHIKWSAQCDTWDWVSDRESPFYRTPDEMYGHLINLMINEKLKGAIILMHFGSIRKNEFPYQMLTKLISALRSQDYKILTISQLLSHREPV
jgi:peptidoglycan/xylan/chitin deacetylase (PgdA/CDA1 family)